MKEQAWLRAEKKRQEMKEARRALMVAARMKAPVAPNQREALALLVGAEALAQAERSLCEANPHLVPERDGPIILSLAYLNVTLAKAWGFFATKAKIAWASRSGKVSWNRGLGVLFQVEEIRRRLSAELAITPASMKSVGLAVNIAADERTTIVIAADTREYIAKLRALRDCREDLSDFDEQVHKALAPAPEPEVVTFTGVKREGHS